MERILLFGGGFDPIHNGHVAAARAAMAAIRADRLVLIPAGASPHRAACAAPDADRLAMCRMAMPDAEVSDIEIARDGVAFTADTLRELTDARPDAAWYYLCGADRFLSMGHWWHLDEILQRVTLVILPREGIDGDALRAQIAAIEASGGRCLLLDTVPDAVSSAAVRERSEAGLSVDGLVPAAVAAYIAEKGLYTVKKRALPTDEQIIEIIRKRESPYRFRHSLAVADAAAALAEKYGGDPAKLYTCGLLHDIFKDEDRSDQLQIFKEFGILLDEVTVKAPKLWHAVAGAAFCERVLGFTDPEMIDAIRYHTTGRAGMRLTEKLLFLADFISADRDYDDIDVMRARADESVEAGMEYALNYTIRDLLERGLAVHPDTVAAYNDVLLHKGGTSDG